MRTNLVAVLIASFIAFVLSVQSGRCSDSKQFLDYRYRRGYPVRLNQEEPFGRLVILREFCQDPMFIGAYKAYLELKPERSNKFQLLYGEPVCKWDSSKFKRTTRTLSFSEPNAIYSYGHRQLAQCKKSWTKNANGRLLKFRRDRRNPFPNLPENIQDPIFTDPDTQTRKRLIELGK